MMKILYIWNGKDKLNGMRNNCIEETRALYPDADYYCVTEDNEIMPFAKKISWSKEKNKLKKFYGLKTFPKQWKNFITFSDWYRFYFLINNPNTLFLDTDCKMVKYFDFENEEKVIYAEQEICLLYAPKNNSFNAMKLTLERHIELKCYGNLLGTCMYIKNQMNSKVLDASYYNHKNV